MSRGKYPIGEIAPFGLFFGRRRGFVASMIRGTIFMRDCLLTAARAYAKAAKVPLRRVSKLAYGDTRFFGRLARGGNVSGDAHYKAMLWFENPAHWPNREIPPGAVEDLFVPQQLAKDHASE